MRLADIVCQPLMMSMKERGGWENIKRRLIGHSTDQRRFKRSKLLLYYSAGLIPLAQKADIFSTDNFVNDNGTPSANRSRGLVNLGLDRQIRIRIRSRVNIIVFRSPRLCNRCNQAFYLFAIQIMMLSGKVRDGLCGWNLPLPTWGRVKAGYSFSVPCSG
jgi:hypothetical protein